MSKYIDAVRLKAEIEKRMHICDGVFERDSDTYYQGKAVAYKETLPLIDSLQQEQPDVDLDADIEMEWDSFNKHLAEYGEESEEVVWLNWYNFNELARYFYELGKKDMKEQMLKDAVEGDYDCQYMTPAVFLDKYLDGIKDGDKVRIIIVKEEK